MGREIEPGRFRGQGRSIVIFQGRIREYFNKSSYASPYKQVVNFGTSFIKQVYTYTAVKDVIFQKVQNLMDMIWQVH